MTNKIKQRRLIKFLTKSKMKKLKIATGILVISSCFITLLLYYCNRATLPDRKSSLAKKVKVTEKTIYQTGKPMMHVNLRDVYQDMSRHYPNESLELEEHTEVNMINTPGCKIPLSVIHYDEKLKHNKLSKNCGKRAVFIKKIDKDKVQALIKPKIIKTYLRKSVIFDCCYRFIKGTTGTHKYTKCIKFQDSAIITLQSDFINVRCFDYDKRNVSHAIYDDVYAFVKSYNVSKQNNCKIKYNVLMIGIDSMSLPRFSMTLPRTVNMFKDNYWLGFRGYHKVGDNTLPNLMAALTGKNLSTITEMCSGKMDQCQKLLIWDKYKKAGYVTAYGEDYLRLPDTFNNKYAFKTPPTDHYMRPLFLKGETELNKRTLVCTGKLTSGQQILNYALDFANTYRSDNFFGLFWINSYSHNANSRPQDADSSLENFFNQLSYTGVLANTFVIVFSDHGVRFGEHRFQVESYYDERMPFLFIWPPLKFKGRQAIKFKSLFVNQFRLLTPFDLYNTLIDIREISSCRNNSIVVSEACPKCHSLLDVVSANRTCQDVGIHDKWCSCHKLYPLPVQDAEGEKSVQTVVAHIKSIIKYSKTKRCWGCMDLSLKTILRIHFYYHVDKISLYYVVAFTMTPSNVSYEATVLFKDGKREIIGLISVISTYKGLGSCTNNSRDRLFCLCQRKENC